MLKTFGWAIAAVAGVALVRAPLTPLLGTQQAYILFVLAVALAAVKAGMWSGVGAPVLGAAGASARAGPPPQPPPWPRLTLSLVVSAGVLLVSREEQQARRRLQTEGAE